MSVRRVCRGPTRAAIGLLVAGIGVVGCGDDSTTGGGGNGGSGGNPATGGGLPNGGGQQGGAGGGAQGGAGGAQGGNGGGVVTLEEFNDVATGRTPFDATPSQNGDTIYYTGDDTALGAGVFKVSSAGGAATAVVTGDPFVAPFGIATATTGSLVYVADPAADEAGDDRGRITSVNVQTNAMTTVVQGFSPVALEVLEEGGNDTIYFTGRSAAGAVGVFKVAASGGAVTPIATGAPIVDPSGIALSSNGDIYFIDTVGSGSRAGRIVQIPYGTSTPQVLLDNISVGYPAGIAIATDDLELWVSGLAPVTLTDVLLRVNVTTQAVTNYTGDADTSITAFEEPAGIHRAKNADIFSFADSRAGGTGTVFALQP